MNQAVAVAEKVFMYRETAVDVQRDVEATLIPSGVKVKLQQGTQVFVTQALGNSYTVYVNGNLVRIAGKDGDALGLVILEMHLISIKPKAPLKIKCGCN